MILQSFGTHPMQPTFFLLHETWTTM
jgi:hypothetical protein